MTATILIEAALQRGAFWRLEFINADVFWAHINEYK